MRVAASSLCLAAGLALAATAALAHDDDDDDWKRHGRQYRSPVFVEVPARPVYYYSQPRVIYAPPPVIYREAPSYYYYPPPTGPSININIPMR